jgi:hypothetical protein
MSTRSGFWLQLWKPQLVLQVPRNGVSIALGELEVSAMAPEFQETWAASVARVRAGCIIIASLLL